MEQPGLRKVVAASLWMSLPFWLLIGFVEALGDKPGGFHYLPVGYALVSVYCLIAASLARALALRFAGREGKPRGFGIWALAVWLLMYFSASWWSESLGEWRDGSGNPIRNHPVRSSFRFGNR